MQRKIEFSVGEYYHVYNRGVDKRSIFLSDADRLRFMTLLYLSNGTRPYVYRILKEQGRPLYKFARGDQRVSIGAYALMPNHFHILVRVQEEGGLSAFMEKLTTGYSMYFNKRNKRTGALFSGRFKAEHVDKDEYLKYLYAYIHLNPVKLIDPDWKENGIRDRDAAKTYLEKYRWSSYPDYLGCSREESAILDPSAFPEYFTEPGDFEAYVDDWLTFKQENEEAWGNPPPESPKRGFAIEDGDLDDPDREPADAFGKEFKEVLRPDGASRQ